MIATAAVAYLAGRSAPTSAVLCAALGGVLLVDPWAVLSAGFWLSFGAVAAILLTVAGWRATPEIERADDGAGDGSSDATQQRVAQDRRRVLHAWCSVQRSGSRTRPACSTR
jgi:competence protein ComEC